MLVKGRWEDPKSKTEMELYFSQFKTGMKTMESIFKHLNTRVKAENQMHSKFEEQKKEKNNAKDFEKPGTRATQEKKFLTSELKV